MVKMANRGSGGGLIEDFALFSFLGLFKFKKIVRCLDCF